MTPTDAEIAQLYERWAPVVMRRARSILGNDELAQDAVQETFARVIARWDQFRGDASPTTWIYQITTNHCLNQLRNRTGRTQKLQQRQLELRPTEPEAVESFDHDVLRRLLSECDEETRRVVVHIYFDEMTREETAQMVQRSVPTVRKRLRQFLESARRQLAGSTAAAALALLALHSATPGVIG